MIKYPMQKEFNGCVSRIDKNNKKFTAELISNDDEACILEGEFSESVLSEDDKKLLRVGALFVWKMGKEEKNGTQRKISQITFKRSCWSEQDIKMAEEIGKKRAAAIRALCEKKE
ncbi:MAG: hypothetical protein LBJ96_00630 [Holosporaceae bacterium]|jgi:hypothetical protein|nr:hypothetical protein [Holosporaceae bacterium]